jgi:hypothetical protein
MNIPASTPSDAGEKKKKVFPWIVFGAPIGCGIGIAIRNLALGVGIGMLLAAFVMVFRAKKENPEIGRVTQIALIVAFVMVIVFTLYLKK